MMQHWLLTVDGIDQGLCTVNPNASSPSISLFPPTDPYPQPTNTNPTTADVLCHDANCNTTINLASLLTQSTSLLNDLKQQSKTLWHLMVLSKELISHMDLILNSLSTLDQYSPPNHTAHEPMPHPTITVSANLKTAPEHVTAIQPDYPHLIPHPDNLLPWTAVPPGLLLHSHAFCNQPSPQNSYPARNWSRPNPLSTADAQQCHGLKILFVCPNLPLVNLVSSIHWTSVGLLCMLKS